MRIPNRFEQLVRYALCLNQPAVAYSAPPVHPRAAKSAPKPQRGQRALTLVELGFIERACHQALAASHAGHLTNPQACRQLYEAVVECHRDLIEGHVLLDDACTRRLALGKPGEGVTPDRRHRAKATLQRLLEQAHDVLEQRL